MQHTRVSYRQKVRRRRVGLFLRLSSETELWNNLPEEVVTAATLQTSELFQRTFWQTECRQQIPAENAQWDNHPDIKLTSTRQHIIWRSVNRHFGYTGPKDDDDNEFEGYVMLFYDGPSSRRALVYKWRIYYRSICLGLEHTWSWKKTWICSLHSLNKSFI